MTFYGELMIEIRFISFCKANAPSMLRGLTYVERSITLRVHISNGCEVLREQISNFFEIALFTEFQNWCVVWYQVYGFDTPLPSLSGRVVGGEIVSIVEAKLQ